MKNVVLGLLLTVAVNLHAGYRDDTSIRVDDCFLTLGNSYFTLGGGAVFPTCDSSDKVFSAAINSNGSKFSLPRVVWKSKFQKGFEINAAAGFSFASRWKIEEEFLYQNMKRDISGVYDWKQTDATTLAVNSESICNPIEHASSIANLYCALSNLYYDFIGCSPWSLSLGGGVGIAWLRSNGASRHHSLHVADQTTPTLEKSPTLRGTAFAWQAKVGLSYAFTECLTIGVNYRLLGTTRFRASRSAITTNPNSNASIRFLLPARDVGVMMNHGANLSLTYQF